MNIGKASLRNVSEGVFLMWTVWHKFFHKYGRSCSLERPRLYAAVGKTHMGGLECGQHWAVQEDSELQYN